VKGKGLGKGAKEAARRGEREERREIRDIPVSFPNPSNEISEHGGRTSTKTVSKRAQR
jgi:hypothetical protein